ncbi:hypothetical protein JR064_21820 [Xanthomonas sp. CFBP 8703]|uniref:Uncharacterized protein n=1 Tax=Xanthomonas bonasiae TaxID=2810351 RepID=A0ABS3BBJ4_9XANT|nr:hypothetical protein [Xanthomonas bonasiae]MBN6104806.1 hypothetical protein [Xanthomonas bonasiae]
MNAWDGIVVFAIGVALVALGLLVWLQHRRDHQTEWLVEQSFRRISVTSDGVLLTGADLVVVKKVQQFMDANYDASFMFDSEAMNGSNAFWYCSGPGARWFLAIPSVTAQRGRVDVQWVVRPLTEQRMRAVLRFDREAYRRAFGAPPDKV